MKILLLADEPDKMLWDYLDKRRLEGIELILACGDLPKSYLEFLTCFTNAPIVYVPGNHDEGFVRNPPEGCLSCDGKIVNVKGLRILGLGGAMRYKPGPYMYSERMMAQRIQKLRTTLRVNRGFDVLITHAPMRGHGDMEDLAHRGYECFAPLLDQYKPLLFAYAHVHATYAGSHFERFRTYNGVRTVNAWKSCIIELDPPPPQRWIRLRSLLLRMLNK